MIVLPRRQLDLRLPSPLRARTALKDIVTSAYLGDTDIVTGHKLVRSGTVAETFFHGNQGVRTAVSSGGGWLRLGALPAINPVTLIVYDVLEGLTGTHNLLGTGGNGYGYNLRLSVGSFEWWIGGNRYNGSAGPNHVRPGRHAFLMDGGVVGFLDGLRIPTTSIGYSGNPTGTTARFLASGNVGNSVNASPFISIVACIEFRGGSISASDAIEFTRRPGAVFLPSQTSVHISAGGAPVLVTATPGNAVAAGVPARVNQARQITGTAGNAVANGVAARINQARAVVGTAGNATAAGITARIDQARRITGSAGNAVADGEAASIYLGRLITATPGDATAAGVTATIFSGAVIQAAPGNAVAAGRPATILGDQIIVGNAGNATAVGVSAQVGQNRQITGNTANATAEGLLASIYAGVTVQATPAAAVADGVDATVLQAITIGATAGDAVAAGRTARIIEGDTPIYAAIPASRKARGRFGERPAQLSTGRRR